MRHFEVCQMIAAKLTQDFGRRFGPGFEDDEGMGSFTPFFVRHADYGGFLNSGMTQEAPLDFDRRDVFAAADDDIFPTVTDLYVAVRMDDCGIGAVKPAVADTRSGGFGVAIEAAGTACEVKGREGAFPCSVGDHRGRRSRLAMRKCFQQV